MTKEHIYAWVAGLLDGEGSLQIKRQRRCNKVHYQVWITVGMSNKEQNKRALDILMREFGGNMCKIRPSGGNRNGAIHWTIVSNQAIAMLNKIQKYMVIKQEHTELLIYFQSLVGEIGKRAKNLEERENVFYEIRKLNTKGRLQLQRLSEKTPKGEAIV
ncbi:hypothetical protein LCGC14_3024830 [marine sediment metagenome]|uniref:Homing endonuclease LAGLIDADG domain-containing protein n=1 Tax=marine sediment metagenome TaxID=412755 RepID=A0A0F8WU38_9ZZZZ